MFVFQVIWWLTTARTQSPCWEGSVCGNPAHAWASPPFSRDCLGTNGDCVTLLVEREADTAKPCDRDDWLIDWLSVPQLQGAYAIGSAIWQKCVSKSACTCVLEPRVTCAVLSETSRLSCNKVNIAQRTVSTCRERATWTERWNPIVWKVYEMLSNLNMYVSCSLCFLSN
jgi:hypothetical protein